MIARFKKFTKDLLRASIGRLGDALYPPPIKLVIFSRGRTGSNLLGWLLKSHPGICHHGEICGESYLQHSFFRNEINRVGVVPYFEWATRRMFAERVVGVKFLYHQLEPEHAARWNVPTLPALLPHLQKRTDFRIIHLKRRNRLATLVSWKLARQTDRWTQLGSGRLSRSLRSGDSLYGELTINLSHEECQSEFDRIDTWERFYDAAFAKHRYIDMYYEDLVADRRGEMRRALELLGLEDRELHAPLSQQNTRGLEDVVENFAELRERFAHTPYGAFFTSDRCVRGLQADDR